MDRLMGLAVFGEKVAARTYKLMSELLPEHEAHLREFASMEGRHGSWFHEASRVNAFVPDREFADNELEYLLAQVERYHAEGDVDALAVLQGFIVECLAISTYDPFVEASRRYQDMTEVFRVALEEERLHVDWITGYLRRRFASAEDELLALVQRVNVQGIDCVGGTLMNITDYLQTVGLSGADCAGGMADEYVCLLENVGIPQREATKTVVEMFLPVIRKYRHGERTK